MTFYISRFKNMDSKEFEVEVVTPMFLCGANNTEAELRVPSIKGMLRFWWRAICGIENLEKMKKKEAKIFGSTSQKAAFLLYSDATNGFQCQIEMKEKGEKFKVHGYPPVSIIDYLAYGTHKPQKGKGIVYNKEHVNPGSKFNVKFVFYHSDVQEDILKAFSFIITHGGLGARSRNGFGSLFVKNCTIFLDNNGVLKNFTAPSAKTKLYIFSQKNSWVDALSDIGMAYREAKLCVEPSHFYNKRKLVVAPITVKKKNKADLERHAKPYLLHVNKLESGKFQGQILFMPYKYLFGRKDYSKDKLNEYLNTCEKMNEKLSELAKVQR